MSFRPDTNYVNWTGQIGYDPSQVTNTYNGLVIKNGIYQPTANNGHTFYFDQITLADTYPEAAGLAANPPRIGNFGVHGTGFSLTGMGGVANAGYRVLTATNPVLPGKYWAPLATGSFATNGTFSFTSSVLPIGASTFYRLAVP